MKTIEQVIQEKQTTTEEALKLFDQLDVVSLEFMNGRWRGVDIASGHPLDGLLEISGWYGKMFVDENTVHPLLFFSHDQKSLFSVDPKYIPLGSNILKLKKVIKLASVGIKFLSNKKSKACLRMMECRGKVTATMIYNKKPIKDFFRKIDENRVLGMMESKAFPQPYFFVLFRDDEREYKISI